MPRHKHCHQLPIIVAIVIILRNNSTNTWTHTRTINLNYIVWHYSVCKTGWGRNSTDFEHKTFGAFQNEIRTFDMFLVLIIKRAQQERIEISCFILNLEIVFETCLLLGLVQLLRTDKAAKRYWRLWGWRTRTRSWRWFVDKPVWKSKTWKFFIFYH